MGTLARIGLADLVRMYDLDTLVETGTGHGHSLVHAVQVPALRDIRSIEIDHETWHRARVVFATEPRVRIYHGESPDLIGQLAAEFSAGRRVLWFLDAHYPGSGRLAPLPMVVAKGGPGAAVPLEAEVAALRRWRDFSRDVIVVDDLCLFEPGAYETDAPELRESLGFASLAWLDEVLEETHIVDRVMRDGGYLIARPRG